MVVHPPPPPFSSSVDTSKPPPPLFEPLTEVNSADLGSCWCGGGGGTDWCVGTGSQGIATEGLTPCEPRYRSVLGNWNFRTGPIPLQLFCLAFFRQAPFQLPHSLVLVV